MELIGEETLQNSKVKIAIMASGTGTNARNLILNARELPHVEITCLISDRKDSGALTIAQEYGVPAHVVAVEKMENLVETKSVHEKKICELLFKYEVEWIFLAGYMRILGSTLLEAYPHKIINIHPSLLPAFPGKDAYKDAFDYGVKVSGVTTHFVDSGIDTGKIIMQDCFSRKPNDNLDEFKNRGLELEHRLYAQTLKLLNDGNLEVKNDNA